MPRPSKQKKKRNKGATLQLQGQVWLVCFRHPQRRDPKTRHGRVVRASLKTSDVRIANRYKEKLDLIIRNPEFWEEPPAGTPERVRQIWFGKRLDVTVGSKHLDAPVKVAPLPGQKRDFIVPSVEEMLPELPHPSEWFIRPSDGESTDAIEDVKRALESLPELADFDYSDRDKAEAVAVALRRLQETLELVRNANDALNQKVVDLESQKADLERQNQLLHLRLSRYEAKELKDAKVGTLMEEYERFAAELDKTKNSQRWKREVKAYLKRFMKAMGEGKPANEITEREVATYVAGLKGMDGQRVSEIMRKRTRETACRFLDFATRGNFNAKLVPTVKTKDIRREAKAIVWLEKKEVDRLLAKIPKDDEHGLYWRDVAQIQVAMGWRPSELLILQTALATDKVITLEPVTDPKTGEIIGKTGGRSVRVPSAAKAAVRRRIKAGHDLLLPKLTRHRKAARGGLLRDAWIEGTFCDQYRSILREAARKARIKKPIDSRTFRRTFGSLQLRAGRKPHEVAELMGDLPETVKRHYARILAHEIDTEV